MHCRRIRRLRPHRTSRCLAPSAAAHYHPCRDITGIKGIPRNETQSSICPSTGQVHGDGLEWERGGEGLLPSTSTPSRRQVSRIATTANDRVARSKTVLSVVHKIHATIFVVRGVFFRVIILLRSSILIEILKA